MKKTQFSLKDICGFCQVDVFIPLAPKRYRECCNITIIQLKNGKVRVYEGDKTK